MKRTLVLLLAVLVAASCQAPAGTSASAKPAPGQTLDPSYAFGLSIGSNLAKTWVKVDQAQLEKGLREGLAGTKTAADADVIKAIQGAIEAARKERGEANAAAEKAYLDTNGKKAGVTTTASGLQYEVLQASQGPKPGKDDLAQIKYKSFTIDGKVLEDTTARDKPNQVVIGRLPPGLSEALQLLGAGGKIKVSIPSALAYGEKGRGEQVEPNQVMIYELELLSFGPAPAPKAPTVPPKK